MNNVSRKINQCLGLLRRIKSLLPGNARILVFPALFYPSLIMRTFWEGGKDNAVLMNNLQLLQNKTAKTILDRPFHSSATYALESLGLLTLKKRRLFIVTFTFINVLMRSQPTVEIYWLIKMYTATTRHKDSLRLPRVRRNWGKHKDRLSKLTGTV